MRTKLSFSFAILALSGCSLAYDGSRFQGGTGTDSGMPGIDTGMPGVDTGVPGSDTGVDSGPLTMCHDVLSCPTAGFYCDISTMTCRPGCDDDGDCMGAGTCDVTAHTCGCTGDSDCGMDFWCSGGQCDRCDNDMDGYYAMGAPAIRCARGAHLEGNDCNDQNASLHPFAPVDCSTPEPESCPLPVALMPMGVNVTEAGLTAEHTLFMDTASLHIVRGTVWGFVGDDMPLSGGGIGNDVGLVGFVAAQADGTGRHVYTAPLTFTGGAATPNDVFDAFEVNNATMLRARGVSGGPTSDAVLIAAVGPGGANVMGTQLGFIARPQMSFGTANMTGYARSLVTDTGGNGLVSAIMTGTRPALVGAYDPVAPDNARVFAGNPVELVQSNNANVMPGAWFAGAATGVIWEGGETQVYVWNGADSTASPPSFDLSAYTTRPGPPYQVLSPSFRADVDARHVGSDNMDHFVAAVPIGSTANPPTGRIALVRWRWPSPSPGERTMPQSQLITVLNTGTAIDGNAGTAVAVVDESSAFVAYVQGNDVIVRPISLDGDAAMPSEDPPSLAVMHTGVGERIVGLDLALGVSMIAGSPGRAIGRVVLVANYEHGAGAMATHEIRVRAIEGCVTLP